MKFGICQYTLGKGKRQSRRRLLEDSIIEFQYHEKLSGVNFPRLSDKSDLKWRESSGCVAICTIIWPRCGNHLFSFVSLVGSSKT